MWVLKRQAPQSLPFFSSITDNRNLNPGNCLNEDEKMTGEEMERAIQFLIEHHAKVSSDIEALKEAQAATAAVVASLADSVSRLEAQSEEDRRQVREMFGGLTKEVRETFDSLTDEMREGFNKLILSNEVTRDLASQVAQLAIATSQRVTVLEDNLK